MPDIFRIAQIVEGITPGKDIEESHLKEIEVWLNEWYYGNGLEMLEEMMSFVDVALGDGKIDKEDYESLSGYLQDFTNFGGSLSGEIRFNDFLIGGVCARTPKIEFEDKNFCFTGFPQGSEKELQPLIKNQGGKFQPKKVTCKTDYLIVNGKSAPNFLSADEPCWLFANRGSKTNRAIELLQKKKYPILIVHEKDFWSALEN